MLHRLWMTKDHTGQVEQLSETAEKGVYIFFDPNTWEKVRVSTKLVQPLLHEMLTTIVERDHPGVLPP